MCVDSLVDVLKSLVLVAQLGVCDRNQTIVRVRVLEKPFQCVLQNALHSIQGKSLPFFRD